MKDGKCRVRVERINSVKRQYDVALASSEALEEALRRNPSLLRKRELSRADLDELVANLAPTYLVYLFAEFETGLRDYWKSVKGSKRGIPVRDMIDSLSSKRSIDDQKRINVHGVRKYRNSLVHEEDSQADPVSIKDARSFLCVFLSYLPEDW